MSSRCIAGASGQPSSNAQVIRVKMMRDTGRAFFIMCQFLEVVESYETRSWR